MSSRVSLIVTVCNEQNTIATLLDSIRTQARPPDEIVIVDGGSTDDTVRTIARLAIGLPIRIIEAVDTNIAQGRNIAIRNANFNLIAVTDAGCRLDENWLREIVAPLESDPSVTVVSGSYLPDFSSTFELCAGLVLFPTEREFLDDEFLPSSRSVAFRKEAWEKIGGYPEGCLLGEDTLFDIKLKKMGFKFVIAKDAVVYYRPRGSLREVFLQAILYAESNARTGILRTTYIVLVVRYALAATLLLAGFSWRGWWLTAVVTAGIYFLIRAIRRVTQPYRSGTVLLLSTVIAIVYDVGQFLGYLRGLAGKATGTPCRRMAKRHQHSSRSRQMSAEAQRTHPYG